MRTVLSSAAVLAFLLVPSHAAAAEGGGDLRKTSHQIEALAKKVSPAVVKILVTGYGPVSQDGRQNAAVIGRQHAIGSGVIVDPNGYVITNAHVVAGAQQIRVTLAQKDPDAPVLSPPRIFKARLVGLDKNTDIAVLKIDATGLPTLAIGDYRKLRQGQLVLAFGSPEGLEDSVTMGVVSSVMRQLDPDQPMIYIQTDAAINPGNSGGPLVDIAGNLVGLNTFILSESGGNEGLGFAIPSVIVRYVYQEILAHKHVHRRVIGAQLQAITPALAAGLNLPQSAGLIVADVLPGGPADQAGLKIQDVLVSLDGAPVPTLPMYEAAVYRKSHGDLLTVEVLRGSGKATLTIPLTEQQQSDFDDLAEAVNPEKSLVPQLGVLGVTVTKKLLEAVQELRIPSGVMVAAKAAERSTGAGLEPGDVIHALNGEKVESVEALRAVIDKLKTGDAVAIQIERDEQLRYVSFEME